MQTFVPVWWRPELRPSRMLSINEQGRKTLWRSMVSGGLMLLLIVMSILLSGCCHETVVYRKPEPYPQLPESMRQYKPAAQELGLYKPSPSTNVKTSPTEVSLTPSGSKTPNK